MRQLTLTLLLCILLKFSAWAQLEGAWKLTYDDVQSVSGREMVAIFSDNYFMFSNYYDDGRFIGAGGGAYRLDGGELHLTYDFYTDDASIVRVPQTYTIRLNKEEFTINGSISNTDFTQKWEKIDEEQNALSAAWRFGTRVDEDGNIGEIREVGPRQTIKILGGGRFQWAAFNYETKDFRGTGGGTYKLDNGTYTEQIEFFSRDDSRVGNSLSFQFERKGDSWFHKGKSSKGDPLHEVWKIID
ncbi:hypothetical protein PZB74_14640 [Porifericola rhodea]|uniref:hypothetical protein n=1 Tax=Porifericola rhodea TaxID=930972 RepID=UPI00266658A8|nr:hypothetical protein [Porifericola rhodea]WKN30201.1 hypothetical protein PZB74_14640 [Porifericola rhodea]